MKKYPFCYRMLLVALFFSPAWLQAQFQNEYHRQNATHEIEAFDVAERPDGFQILGLHNGAQEIIMTNLNGDHVLDRTFDFSGPSYQVESKTMAVSSTGTTYLAAGGTSLDIRSYDAAGAPLNGTRIVLNHDATTVESVYEIEMNSSESAVYIHALLKGQFGSTNDPTFYYGQAILKVNTALTNLEWVRWVDTWTNSSNSTLQTLDGQGKFGDLYPTADGGVAFTGPMNPGYDFFPGTYIAALVLDGSGNTIWNKYYIDSENQESNSEGTAIIESLDGEETVYYIGGLNEAGDAVIIKTDASGNTNWITRYNTSSVEPERLFIRGIRKLEEQETLAIVGEHETNAGSLAFSGMIQSDNGLVINSRYIPNCERLTDILFSSQNEKYYASAETREEDGVQYPGLIEFNAVFGTECSYAFELDEFEYDLLPYSRSFGGQEFGESYELLFAIREGRDLYSKEDNCCRNDDGEPIIYLVEPPVKGDPPLVLAPDPLIPGSYLWDNGSTDIGLTIFDGYSGIHRLLVLGEDGCWYSFVFAFDSSGEKRGEFEFEEGTNAVSILPNPSDAEFNFNFENELTGSIEIMDINGRLIQAISLTGQRSTSVDLSAFESGMYFAVIRDQNTGNTVTERIVLH